MLGPERGEDVVALGLGELVERQLVVVAQEDRPAGVGRDRGQLADHGLERLGLPARERQPQVLVDEERELHVQLVAVLAEVAGQLVEAEVDLAEQQRVAAAAVDERAQAAQPLLRLVLVDVLGQAGGLEQRRHGVHPEARDAQLPARSR